MAENLQKRPAKGILKNSSSFDKQDVPAQSRRTTTFDEMNIIATLHPPDKDYGHMKIDEPKTPYNFDEEELDQLDAAALAEKIKQASEEPPKYMQQDDDDDEELEDDADLTEEERQRRKEFRQKRKKHYNEFYAVQLARKLLEEEEDDDDDDDEERKSPPSPKSTRTSSPSIDTNNAQGTSKST